jgi:hypothetical protein
LWPGVIQDFESEQLPELLSHLDRLIAAVGPAEKERLEILYKQREIALTTIEEYKRSAMPRAIELETLVGSEMERVCRAITAMRWQFFEAPNGKIFLTSDNPVHWFHGGVGLRMPYSELVFPISSKLALIASYRDVLEGFVGVNGQAVNEINRRVASQARHYVYASSATRWALALLKKTTHRFGLLYSFNDRRGEFPRVV